MSTKNFISNGDAETLFTGIGNKLSTLKSGLTNLDNEVNGDATVYPYADVITIPDAVPSNLADCSVKIEPVQDLHGFDHPWVGGAGKNKLPMTVGELKSLNSSGTWNGNVYSIDNGTIEILTDEAGNVTGIKCNWSAALAATTTFLLLYGGSIADYAGKKLSCEEVTQTEKSIAVQYYNGNTFVDSHILDANEDYVIENKGDNIRVFIRLQSGSTVTNETFRPMLRLATETDATFAPYTNICPISGHIEASVQRDGKNLLDDSIVGLYQAASDPTVKRYGYAPFAIKAGVYTISYTNTQPTVKLYLTDMTDWTYVEIDASGTTVTITKDTTVFLRSGLSTSEIDFRNNFFDTIVELGQTATSYVPYAGKTYTITLGDTIYGGEVDFDSGVMTMDRAIVDLGSLDYVRQATGTSGKYRFNAALTNAKPVGSNNDKPNALCSEYDIVTPSNTYNCIDGVTVTTAGSVNIYAENYNDVTAEDFKSAMDGVQFCYELATPFTVQLTPQQIQLLKGHNTLTASTGDISVTVNGVSGAIGAVQEQVNELAESVVDRFDNVVGWSENKNLIPLTLKEIKNATIGGTWNGNKYTIDGVEYEVIIDAKGCVSKIRANGTPTSSSATFLIMNKPSINPGTAIISTGTDAKGSSTTYGVTTLDGSWGNQQNVYDSKTVTVGISKVQLKVYAGYTAENLDFRPMVRNASISDPTYEPYHELIGKSVNGLLDRVPTAPITDGTYSLQVTVASGIPTYSWVSNA